MVSSDAKCSQTMCAKAVNSRGLKVQRESWLIYADIVIIIFYYYFIIITFYFFTCGYLKINQKQISIVL